MTDKISRVITDGQNEQVSADVTIIRNKSAQSNLARWPRPGAVAYVRPIGPCGQLRAPNSSSKVPLPVDRSPNPTTCLISGPVRPTMPNGTRIRSAVFPQCTGQADTLTHRQTDRSSTGKFRHYRPLRSESDAA